MKNNLLKIVAVIIVITFTYGINKQYRRLPDANDVFEKHFSKYHFTEEAKNEVMTELKLIVNYLSYVKATGQDYLKEIRFLQDYAHQEMSGNLFQDEVLSLKESPSSSIIKKGSPSEFLESSSYCIGFSSFMEEQKTKVQQYHLPYTLDRSALQVLNISASMIVKEELYDTDLSDSLLHQSSPEKQQLNTLWKFNWQSGDILLAHRDADSDDNAIQGYYNHSGIYSAECDCIIDAAPPNGSEHFQGGVRKSEWGFWEENYSNFVILRFPQLPVIKRKQIEAYAFSKLDSPYNLMTYKKSEESGWYCSKLIYMAYLTAGINLDSKNGVTIFPDDLAMGFSSGNVFCLDRSDGSLAKSVVNETYLPQGMN